MTQANNTQEPADNPLVATKHYRVNRRTYRDLISYSITGFPCQTDKCWPPQVTVSKSPISLRVYERFDHYKRNLSIDEYADLVTYMTGIRDELETIKIALELDYKRFQEERRA